MCTPSRRRVAFDALEARNLFAATINELTLVNADTDRTPYDTGTFASTG